MNRTDKPILENKYKYTGNKEEHLNGKLRCVEDGHEVRVYAEGSKAWNIDGKLYHVDEPSVAIIIDENKDDGWWSVYYNL